MKTFNEYISEMSSDEYRDLRKNGPTVHAVGTPVKVQGQSGKVVGHSERNGQVTHYDVLHNNDKKITYPAISVMKEDVLEELGPRITAGKHLSPGTKVQVNLPSHEKHGSIGTVSSHVNGVVYVKHDDDSRVTGHHESRIHLR